MIACEHTKGPILSQKFHVCEIITKDNGAIIGYKFANCKSKSKYYYDNYDKIGAAIEKTFRVQFTRFEYGSRTKLVGEFEQQFRRFSDLAEEIGFVYTAKRGEREESFIVPTVEYAQAKIDDLGIPVKLVKVSGVASHEQFLSMQLANSKYIVVLVSQDVEFYHDMTVHVLNVIKMLTVHYQDDRSPRCKHQKEEQLEKYGSYFEAFMVGAKLFAKVFNRAKSLENKRHRDALIAYLASLYDIYTTLDTGNEHIIRRVSCLLTGEHEGLPNCKCFHETGDYDGRSFASIYLQPGFVDNLREAVRLIRSVK